MSLAKHMISQELKLNYKLDTIFIISEGFKKEEISFLKYGLIPLKIYKNFVIFKKQLKDYESIYLVLDIQNILEK